jgi:hypothetical protein
MAQETKPLEPTGLEHVAMGASQNGVEGIVVDDRDERAILLAIERNTAAQASTMGRIADAIERLEGRFGGGVLNLLGRKS